MAKNKWTAVEFTPKPNQIGMSHSWSGKAVVDNTITTPELAHKVHVEGSISSDFEVEAILKVAARVIFNEVKENNRVQLDTGDGVLVTFSPKCSGSISDAYVQAHPDQFGGKQVAEEDMLTPDMLQWNIKAEVGQKFSKQFAQQKQAQKVRVTSTANVVDADEEPAAEPGNGGNGGSNPPSGGGENEE